MKKIILLLWVVILTQFTLTNANNDLFSSCSEKEITQTETQKLWWNKDTIIKEFISKNNLWEILWNVSYSTNWNYVFISYIMNEDWEKTFNIVHNGKIVKTFTDNINDREYLKLDPSVVISKDWKKIAYTYKNNDKYCVNNNWNDTCYFPWYDDWADNWEDYSYPINLTYSDNWDSFWYTIIKWMQWDWWKSYENAIIINWKEIESISKEKLWYDRQINQPISIPWDIKNLVFSPNWKDYAYIVSNPDTWVTWIYKNNELVNIDLTYLWNDSKYWLWYENASIYFSLDSKDFYFTWFKWEEYMIFKNWWNIDFFPQFFEWKNWLWFEMDYLSWGIMKSYYLFNSEKYLSKYLMVNILKNDWKNVNFFWIDEKYKTYNVSCVLKNDLTKNTSKLETQTTSKETEVKSVDKKSKEEISVITNKETEVKSVEEKSKTETYKLSSKEKEAIKIVANKISKSWVWKKSKYLIKLNQLLEKLEKWSRKYEIINWVLYELDSIWLENFGNMLNN